MQGISPRFLTLLEQIVRLMTHLLPEDFDEVGDYDPAIRTRALALRVLAHAEMEAYIEDRAEDVSLSAIRAWKADGTVGRTTLALLAFSGVEMELPPPTRDFDDPSKEEKWPEKIEVGRRIDKCRRIFVHARENNHGLKEHNLMRLLLPIGVDPKQLDGVWLSDMNSFGERRGEAAHQSSSAKSTVEIADPKSERDTINKLLPGFMELDIMLSELVLEGSSSALR